LEESVVKFALVKLVRDAIQAAKDNDYDMSGHSDEDLAGDLMAYEYTVENESFENILAAVKVVRRDGLVGVGRVARPTPSSEAGRVGVIGIGGPAITDDGGVR
jgi:hypothetical protein